MALGAEDADVYTALADIHTEDGRLDAAVSRYHDALRLNPAHLSAANNLAWLLATTPDERLRNPAEAVRRAEGMIEGGRAEHPALLDTLAASYASAGRFDDATRTAQRALALATANAEPELAAEIRRHMALYRSGRAFVAGADGGK